MNFGISEKLEIIKLKFEDLLVALEYTINLNGKRNYEELASEMEKCAEYEVSFGSLTSTIGSNFRRSTEK